MAGDAGSALAVPGLGLSDLTSEVCHPRARDPHVDLVCCGHDGDRDLGQKLVCDGHGDHHHGAGDPGDEIDGIHARLLQLQVLRHYQAVHWFLECTLVGSQWSVGGGKQHGENSCIHLI